MKPHLRQVLEQRRIDVEFLDERTQRCAQANQTISFDSADYQTPIGHTDDQGRLVVGPHQPIEPGPTVHIPDFSCW